MARILLTAALALPLLAAPALADDAGLCRTGITAEDAIRIARAAGIARVQEVDCDDGRWEVEDAMPRAAGSKWTFMPGMAA